MANDFLNPNGLPFDPIGEALKNIDRINKLAAAEARIKQLEERNELMREAGDEIWYVLRHADKVTAEDIMNACQQWADKRRHG
jgi:hypothetical protein